MVSLQTRERVENKFATGGKSFLRDVKPGACLEDVDLMILVSLQYRREETANTHGVLVQLMCDLYASQSSLVRQQRDLIP